MPRLGAHVSASVSLDLSLERATIIGAECSQIFVSPPQQWAQTTHSEEEIEGYLNKLSGADISPNFIHGTYLINLATDKPENLEKSISFLIYALNLSQKLKTKGVIFHTGSHKGKGFENFLGQIVDALKRVLTETNNSNIILENCAGSGGVIGSFTELGEILTRTGDDRMGVCLDTQHAFAAGYDLSNSAGIEAMIEDFDKEIGLNKLMAIHCNDSKVELGSRRDRHENIGEGFIGEEGFKLLVNHPKLANVPFILEVPGVAGNGPDKENVDKLRSFMSKINR